MNKNIAILHEGNNKKTQDNELIKLLINYLKLDCNQVEFFGMCSKSNFFKQDYIEYKKLKPMVESNEIEKILFIIDADDEKNDKVYGGYNNTENALLDMINKLCFSAISDFYIMCDPVNKTGYLESFILSTLPEKQKHCIEQFLECSEFKSKENHKAIVHSIYRMAYPEAPYNFEHSNFDLLKIRLTNLFSG